MWAEVCSKAEHTEGPWDTGVAAGGRYLSWGEFLGTRLCFLVPEPWCQGAFGILLHPSCGQQHCCPIPGRNNLQNINLCFCKSLEGALTLEVHTRCLRRLVTTLSPGEGPGSLLSRTWSHPLPLHEFHRSVAVCNEMGQTTFLGQRVVFCSSSATICSVVHHGLWGAVSGNIIEVPSSDGFSGPIRHLLIIKLVGSLSLYFHCTYARINFRSW